jgi:hypothetical protein
MDQREIPFEDVIRLRRNPDMLQILDVELDRLLELRRFDSIECHVTFYPYSRKITASEVMFCPFEEYVKDILSNQRSAYVRMASGFNKLFGIALGVVIALFFLLFKPADLFSVQSVVSIFGAYVIGKEIWEDIAKMLVSATKNSRLRFVESYYSYELEKNTTMTLYSQFAKRNRYGKSALLPEKMEFILQSNSQTLRMSLDMKDLKAFPDRSAHLFSIHVRQGFESDLEKDGYMFGVKMSFSKKRMGLTFSGEMFQSVSRGAHGCLDPEGAWHDGALFFRKTVSLGRLKYYRCSGMTDGVRMISLA